MYQLISLIQLCVCVQIWTAATHIHYTPHFESVALDMRIITRRSHCVFERGCVCPVWLSKHGGGCISIIHLLILNAAPRCHMLFLCSQQFTLLHSALLTCTSAETEKSQRNFIKSEVALQEKYLVKTYRSKTSKQCLKGCFF